jgi:hypothetical protein
MGWTVLEWNCRASTIEWLVPVVMFRTDYMRIKVQEKLIIGWYLPPQSG